MAPNGDISVVFEDGVLKPESELELPEHSRLVIEIQRVAVTDDSRAEGRRVFHEIREKGLLRSNGWRLKRDELYERD